MARINFEDRIDLEDIFNEVDQIMNLNKPFQEIDFVRKNLETFGWAIVELSRYYGEMEDQFNELKDEVQSKSIANKFSHDSILSFIRKNNDLNERLEALEKKVFPKKKWKTKGGSKVKEKK